MSVKVGLETSSGSAAFRPLAIPLAKVVLPAPRFPIRSTTAWEGNSCAICSPTAMVSCSEAVSKRLTNRLREEAKDIGCDERMFAEPCRAQLAGPTVNPDGGADRGLSVVRELSHHSCDQAGEDIA